MTVGLVVAMLVSGSAVAAEPLAADEIQALFSDKTFNVRSEATARTG